jgi:hypothetical protein
MPCPYGSEGPDGCGLTSLAGITTPLVEKRDIRKCPRHDQPRGRQEQRLPCACTVPSGLIIYKDHIRGLCHEHFLLNRALYDA